MANSAPNYFRRLRRLIYLCLFLSLAWFCWLKPLAGLSGPTPTQLNDGWPIQGADQVGIAAGELNQLAESLFLEKLKVHSLLIERHGNLVAEYYQGGPDKSVYSLFPVRQNFNASEKHDIRSITKSVTSLLYGIALEQCKVPAVSEPLWPAFPEYQGLKTTANQALRIEDILQMASGLTWQEGGLGLNDELRLFWRRDLFDYVMSHPQANAPGQQFNYNGGNTVILAELIRRGTGQTIDEFADINLFKPLQISDWEWRQDLHGRAMVFNGLRLRPRDLLKIGRLIQNHGVWQGRQIVPRAWLDKSMTGVYRTTVRDYRYGYQWWHGTADWHGQQLAWHAGFGNGGQRLYMVPALDLSVVTTAGAYDELPTAIRVNDLIQQVVNLVSN